MFRIKSLSLILLLSITGGSHGQSSNSPISFATHMTIISPFTSAMSLLKVASETVEGTTVLSYFTTIVPQDRGVAEKEQLRDELVGVNEDIIHGRVSDISDVRQLALRELFAEIAADRKKMELINSILKEHSELHKIATAVTLELMLN